MAALCAACGSADTGAMADTYVCHNCGAVTNYRGDLVAKETTEPTSPEPLVVSVSPAGGDGGKRIVTTQGPDGPTTEEIDADPDNNRGPAVGSRAYDELHADVGRKVEVDTAENGDTIVSTDPIVGSDGEATQERDAPNPGVVGDTVDDGPIEPPLTEGMPPGSTTEVPDVGEVPTGPDDAPKRKR